MIFTIANKKGGVGKTTVTQNLAAGLVRAGYSVLAIDLDEQANLSQSFGLQADIKENIFNVLEGIENGSGEPSLQDILFRITDGPHLIPSGPGMEKIDVRFSSAIGRERLLKKALKPIRGNYDVILLDAPPSFNLATQNALFISDFVLIPVLAEYLPVKGIGIFIDNVKRFIDQAELDSLSIGGIILNQPKPRTHLGRDLMEVLNDEFKEILFKTVIRQNIALSEAQAMGKDIFSYDESRERTTNGARDFEALTNEVIKRFAS